jgi:enoyl-[acyl-carrier protein] reductase / trans-2-enoyl-CoA reductase (NAD+)
VSDNSPTVEVFKKLPLGGVDRRSLVEQLAAHGPAAARQVLEDQRARLKPQGAKIASDTAVLILGGSNGITRALAVQLLFGERAAVFCVHYDSEKMQIGGHHAAAIREAAAKEGLTCEFFNRDATRMETVEEVIAALKGRYRAVHFINGVASGATKRYAKHGPDKVQELDVAFDPVLQIPKVAERASYRRFGWVEVDVATDVEIERTNKFMGTSSLFWVEPLAAAGLIAKGESAVSFCDYDYEPDDPVYAMGPLAGAKILQRETMATIRERFGVRTVRLCYPAMCTTALGAIPGGIAIYCITAQILKEQNAYQSIDQLAAATMKLWKEPLPERELRLDDEYQRILPEWQRRKKSLTADPSPIPGCFFKLFEGGPI